VKVGGSENESCEVLMEKRRYWDDEKFEFQMGRKGILILQST
jgi:hypothetical protein